MGGWVSAAPPPGGGGHLSVYGYAKILGGWVPELTPPPLGWLSKTLPVPPADGGRISSSYSPWEIRTVVFGATIGCTAAAARGQKPWL